MDSSPPSPLSCVKTDSAGDLRDTGSHWLTASRSRGTTGRTRETCRRAAPRTRKRRSCSGPVPTSCRRNRSLSSGSGSPREERERYIMGVSCLHHGGVVSFVVLRFGTFTRGVRRKLHFSREHGTLRGRSSVKTQNMCAVFCGGLVGWSVRDSTKIKSISSQRLVIYIGSTKGPLRFLFWSVSPPCRSPSPNHKHHPTSPCFLTSIPICLIR